MDWLDYREKLRIGFSDDEKLEFFKKKIFNVLDGISINSNAPHAGLSYCEYYDYCNTTGSEMNHFSSKSFDDFDRFRFILRILHVHCGTIRDFFTYYMPLINTIESEEGIFGKSFFRELISRMLNESHIPYEIIEDEDGYFIFPRGAKELDGALVSEPLEWLSSYPKTRKTFVNALNQYTDGIYIRDVADNFRKALEEFFQEFLGNTKNLANNKTEICRYLKDNNAESEISSMYQSLINAYDTLNNKVAKHNDMVDSRFLEFLMYQTGVFIRMLIVVKQSET